MRILRTILLLSTMLSAQQIKINSSVLLAWNPSQGAQNYNIKRSTTNGGPYTTIKVANPCCQYTDKKVAAPGTYYYVVTAQNTGGTESNNSNQVTVVLH